MPPATARRSLTPVELTRFRGHLILGDLPPENWSRINETAALGAKTTGPKDAAMNSRGTTLLELVVAAGLLAIAAIGLFRLYAVGIAAGQHAERLAIAVALAQARMEEVASNPTILTAWEATNETIPVAGYRVTSERVEEAGDLQRATATVRWVWRGQPRQTSVTTIMLDPTSP